jgi:hypothetical protein
MSITEALDKITFETKSTELMDGGTSYYVEAVYPKDGPREFLPVIETMNDVGVGGIESDWNEIELALDGDIPYWTGGDSMEINVEPDGTWFREQEGMRHSEGTKLPNDAVKRLFTRFVEASKQVGEKPHEQ